MEKSTGKKNEIEIKTKRKRLTKKENEGRWEREKENNTHTQQQHIYILTHLYTGGIGYINVQTLYTRASKAHLAIWRDCNQPHCCVSVYAHVKFLLVNVQHDSNTAGQTSAHTQQG